MAQLALRGHATRGEEVIKILEMLGGVNHYDMPSAEGDLLYTIRSHDKFIIAVYPTDTFIVFTLEEFLEKYPYKVGDRVLVSETQKVVTIEYLSWRDDKLVYETCYNEDCVAYYAANDLQPYKEETMKANKEFKQKYCRNCGSQRCSGDGEWLEECEYYKNEQRTMEEIKMDIPNGYEFAGVDDDKQQVVFTKIQPEYKYPKTYKGCIGMLPINWDGNVEGYKCELLVAFQKLLIARDIYWKIAGEQMGLDKPWKPDWDDGDEEKFCIEVRNDNELCDITYLHAHRILAFPTMELLDIFAENFKELIESCKELL